jgi:hypothetical protein
MEKDNRLAAARFEVANGTIDQVRDLRLHTPIVTNGRLPAVRAVGSSR